MTTQVTDTACCDVQIEGVACLLLGIEAARGFVCRPMARLGEDFVAVTVFIDLGDGPLPFPLDAVRLAARCLVADPPFIGAAELGATLAEAADTAEAAALQLMNGLH